MSEYNVIMASDEATVVAEYEPQTSRSDAYQSEADLESAFIKLLQEQGYEYININCQTALIENLRTQIEKLNDFKLTDKEWKNLFENYIANSNDGIVEKTRTIQEDPIKTIRLENGSSKNIKLIDKNNIHKNSLQVINQYEENNGVHKNRYDVTILVNGLPLVHVELKRRGVAIKEAFNQIDRYQRESFWVGCGLFEYVQIFVISNGTNTKYYSNTTRNSHIKENVKNNKKNSKKTSNSFEFTSYWADGKNRIINDLVDFTKTFLSKHTILNIITRYCIFTTENILMVMRPYQIVATEKIINRIVVSTNYHKEGTLEAGGYIWHTTGSGKTLTSFKTAQLASKLDCIDKVIFVVDRKDLDYQTIKEYDKFEKGAANSNKNTAILKKQLEDNDCKIIVTTIQKLSIFINSNPKHEVYNKQIVLIFDECHRSQFGDMHKSIVSNFKKYHLFGFTGTPIFGKNASNTAKNNLKTTAQIFGGEPDENGKRVKPLHTYTIVNAINDKNVLPFNIDYVNTFKSKENISDKDIQAINTEEILQSKERVKNIVSYIIENFDTKTMRNTYYSNKGKRLNGFNSIFAVSSIPMAKKYYYEFKEQLAQKHKDLKIATIFSFAPNEEDGSDGILAEEGFDPGKMDVTSREFLDNAISDYNAMFKTNFDTSAKGFQDYYKDLTMKVKDRDVDLLIVVNMFLTGFDATTLNTLWVDKNLKQHGLIQAFSRTNRILNSVKTYGNIVCFRDLEKETEEAISLFGDENASGIVLLKSFNDYYYGYEDENDKFVKGYEQLIEEFLQNYPLDDNLVTLDEKKHFVKSFGQILKLRNILISFEKFKGKEIITPYQLQNYQSKYLDIKDEFKACEKEKTSVIDDVVFEIELVKTVQVNIDYVLELVKKYHESNCDDKELLGKINSAVLSSIELRSKKDLINQFVNEENMSDDVVKAWKKFVFEQKNKEIQELISNNKLKKEETEKFLENSFRDGTLKTTGTDIDKIMPPVSLFGFGGTNRTALKHNIVNKLNSFFEKYFGIV